MILLLFSDDSTFSFDPSVLNVKKLNKNNKKKIDSRKGVLLASYSKKKTRRKKIKGSAGGGKDGGNGSNHESNGNETVRKLQFSQRNDFNEKLSFFFFFEQPTKNHSSASSPSHSPRHSSTERPTDLALKLPQKQHQQQQRQQQKNSDLIRKDGTQQKQTRICFQDETQKNSNMLQPPTGGAYRGQLQPSSRQASSNSSVGGGVNRESSQDDSGVVDDHEEQDITGSEMVHVSTVELQNELTPVTLALSPREVRLIKCNGNIARIKKHNIYALHPEYSSEVVVIGK